MELESVMIYGLTLLTFFVRKCMNDKRHEDARRKSALVFVFLGIYSGCRFSLTEAPRLELQADAKPPNRARSNR